MKLAEGNWVRQGQTEDTTLVEHQNPEFVVQPRWWVEESEVARPRRSGGAAGVSLLQGRNQSDQPAHHDCALIPPVAVVNSAPLVLHGEHISPRMLICLLANLNSFVFDFVARQKVGGLHLNFFIVNQLPAFPPVEYAKKCPWNKRTSLETWISERALKLTCTANDMKPFAAAAGFDPPVHRWDADARAELLAELDAAFLLLYGIDREDVQYILGTFAGLRSEESSLPGFRSTTTRILDAYDRLCL